MLSYQISVNQQFSNRAAIVEIAAYKTIKIMEGKRITVEGHFIYTGWPLFQQLSALDAEIKLTANTPYPTFSIRFKNAQYLFNQNGGDVNTMQGTFTAFSFDEVKDIRDLHNLEWTDGWN